jgi:hypothetical protein
MVIKCCRHIVNLISCETVCYHSSHLVDCSFRSWKVLPLAVVLHWCGLWPTRSTDLTPPDFFFLWDLIKGMVNMNEPSTIDDLKVNIRQENAAIPGACYNVYSPIWSISSGYTCTPGWPLSATCVTGLIFTRTEVCTYNIRKHRCVRSGLGFLSITD